MFGNLPTVVDDFVQVGWVNAQLRRQPFRADGRALRKESSEVVGEGEGSVHWRNISNFDWNRWSKLRQTLVRRKQKIENNIK